ncbi:DUF7301 family protein [Serratia marcescens]|uniref:DUF7301 family protein n=1 Tax=Serratia marcescens TaxID=615 RepID=UPI0007C8C625|nr:hypothetical protein AYJ10_11565 [Serratia marcescens]
MTTASELISRDLLEWDNLQKRYWNASSLPHVERFKHNPKRKQYRRDRVLIRILKLNIDSTRNRIARGMHDTKD